MLHIKKNNDEKIDNNKPLEAILKNDLMHNQSIHSNSCHKKESKSSEKLKELISGLEKKKFDMNKNLLSDEDFVLIRSSFMQHFLFANLSDEIMYY